MNKCILIAGTSILKIMLNFSTDTATEKSDVSMKKIKPEKMKFLFNKIVKMLSKNSLTKTLTGTPNLLTLGSEKIENENKLLFYFNKIYVPKSMRIEVIRCHHDDERAGHFEVQKTLKLMQKNYYWPGPVELKKLTKKLTLNHDEFNSSNDNAGFKEMRAKIEKYIEHCAICRKSKAPRHKSYEQLSNLFIGKYKGSNITLNFVTELSPNMNGNDFIYNFILVMINKFTKMTHYVSVIKKIIAPNLFEILNRKVFKLHDLLITMISDRNSLIISKFWKKLSKFFKFDRRFNTAYHSQSNGQTEKQNSTMKQYFRAYINFQQNDWVK